MSGHSYFSSFTHPNEPDQLQPANATSALISTRSATAETVFLTGILGLGGLRASGAALVRWSRFKRGCATPVLDQILHSLNYTKKKGALQVQKKSFSFGRD